MHDLLYIFWKLHGNPWIDTYIREKWWDVIGHPLLNCKGRLVRMPLNLEHGWVIRSHTFMYVTTYQCSSLFNRYSSTYWGLVTHICVSKLTIIGSDNGLSPGRRQAVIRTNAGILLIWPIGIHFSEISVEIHTFPFKQMCWKMSSAKWRACCLGLCVICIICDTTSKSYMPISCVSLLYCVWLFPANPYIQVPNLQTQANIYILLSWTLIQFKISTIHHNVYIQGQQFVSYSDWLSYLNLYCRGIIMNW